MKERPTNPQLEKLHASLSSSNQKRKPGMEAGKPTPFPVEVFPKVIQEMIREAERVSNFPPDYSAGSILTAISIAMGNYFQLEVSSTWTESALIYLALVGPPGSNKSHPLSFFLKPIFKRDSELYQFYQEQEKEYESHEDKKGQPFPILKKHIVNDITPEALIQVHAQNPKGIGLYVDELISWIGNFGRYNKSAEQEFWLSNWSGKPIIRDRVNGKSIFIPNPYISVVGTIQPGKLRELGKNGRDLNGFTDRILFCFPDVRAKPWNDGSIASGKINNWNQVMAHILDIPPPDKDFYTLRMDKEAFQVIKNWQSKNTIAINQADEENLKGLLSKLEIHLLRLCLILQVLKWATNGENKEYVEAEIAADAVKLIGYFQEHGVRANSLVTGIEPIKGYDHKRKQIFEALPDQFETKVGIQIAEKYGMKERTFKNFIKDRKLFSKIGHGQYEKL